MNKTRKHLLLFCCTIGILLACNFISSSGSGAFTPTVPEIADIPDSEEAGAGDLPFSTPTTTDATVDEINVRTPTPAVPTVTGDYVQSDIDVGRLPLACVATGWGVKGAGNEIFLTNPEGSEVVSVSNSRESDIDPAWSWDGSRIAFASKRDGDFEIYVMDPDGGNQARLTNDPARDAHPTWSPEGNKIAFTSDRDGNAEIYVMDSDGSDPQRLTDRPSPENYPAWSPDGSSIAFSSFGADDGTGIFLMDANGENVRLLAAGPLHSPAWSPDGKRLAFDGEPGDCKFEVYVMNLDEPPFRAITTHPDGCGGYNKHPTWSPDGEWIAFWSMRGEQNVSNLYRIKPDGTGETQITFYEDNPDLYRSPHDPVWSPAQVMRQFDYHVISFAYPSDWQMMSELWPNYQPQENYKNLGVDEIASVTSVKRQGQFGIWFTVATTSLANGDLKSLIDQTYAQTVPGIEETSAGTTEVSGMMGFEIRYRRPWGDPWWEFRDIWLEKDGKVYVLSFEALALDGYQDAMDGIIDSFAFK